MADGTPATIGIDRQVLTILQRMLAAAQPAEACALLLGRLPVPGAASAQRAALKAPVLDAGATATRPSDTPPASEFREWEIRLIWPCLNVWEPAEERPRRFALDPREQLLAQRWARGRDLQVLGAAHSHPTSPAVPSATDLSLAVAPCLQLILSPLDGWAPACWWLELTPQGDVRPRPLPWKMVD